MKKILFAIVGVCLATWGFGQEYKVAKSSGRLVIREVNSVVIEGYNGNEVVFMSRTQAADKDPRAAGLRALSSLGLEDNTGIGLSVVDKGDVIEVNQLKKTEGPKITIRVPKGMKVEYSHSSPFGDALEIKDFAGDVSVTTVHNNVSLVNTTGPTLVKTVHGGIEASLGNPLTASVTLESVHGHVDVALPLATKANLVMSTEWGEVLVDPGFRIELERTGDLQKYSGRIKGKINGGGTEITLISSHNNVYLRKK